MKIPTLTFQPIRVAAAALAHAHPKTRTPAREAALAGAPANVSRYTLTVK